MNYQSKKKVVRRFVAMYDDNLTPDNERDSTNTFMRSK